MSVPISTYRILLVEDEHNVGITLSERLQQESYEVVWVQNIAAAKQEVTTSAFDLILLDVMLPDGSGFDFAAFVRALDKTQGAIVFLTALGSTDSRISGLELGAEDYIVKPFHLKELRLRIRNILKNRVALSRNTQAIRIGRAKIYFDRYQAEASGKIYTLTQKECTLLKLLVDEAESVVSRDSILNQVWSEDEFPSPRTVDNFIVRLRRIIEESPDHPKHIRSVRGVGYQLTY